MSSNYRSTLSNIRYTLLVLRVRAKVNYHPETGWLGVFLQFPEWDNNFTEFALRFGFPRDSDCAKSQEYSRYFKNFVIEEQPKMT